VDSTVGKRKERGWERTWEPSRRYVEAAAAAAAAEEDMIEASRASFFSQAAILASKSRERAESGRGLIE
jgi:hypothetical protein